MSFVRPRENPSPSREAGFTVIEMIITLIVLVEIIIAALLLFDLSNRITRVQTNVSEMQQSARVAQDDMVRQIRMAGRGGVPQGGGGAVASSFAGRAVSLANNVGNSAHINPADNTTPKILPGTDVLAIRGIITSPIFQINYLDPGGDFTLDTGSPATATQGTITVKPKTNTFITQDLQPLIDAINAGTKEAIMLVSSRNPDLYAVVELDTATSAISATQVVVGFKISGGTYSTDYLVISSGGIYPPTLDSVAFIGILEEYRYYIREERAVPGDNTTELAPRLSRARVFPGTNAPHGGAGDWSVDVADYIFDLQVALGFDTTNGGAMGDDPNNTGVDDTILETADGVNDDWLFNGTGDDGSQAVWNNGLLYYARVSTLARTDRPDPKYSGRIIVSVEDNDYTGNALNNVQQRMFRRRLLQTVIDLRNVG